MLHECDMFETLGGFGLFLDFLMKARVFYAILLAGNPCLDRATCKDWANREKAMAAFCSLEWRLLWKTGEPKIVKRDSLFDENVLFFGDYFSVEQLVWKILQILIVDWENFNDKEPGCVWVRKHPRPHNWGGRRSAEEERPPGWHRRGTRGCQRKRVTKLMKPKKERAQEFGKIPKEPKARDENALVPSTESFDCPARKNLVSVASVQMLHFGVMHTQSPRVCRDKLFHVLLILRCLKVVCSPLV